MLREVAEADLARVLDDWVRLHLEEELATHRVVDANLLRGHEKFAVGDMVKEAAALNDVNEDSAVLNVLDEAVLQIERDGQPYVGAVLDDDGLLASEFCLVDDALAVFQVLDVERLLIDSLVDCAYRRLLFVLLSDVLAAILEAELLLRYDAFLLEVEARDELLAHLVDMVLLAVRNCEENVRHNLKCIVVLVQQHSEPGLHFFFLLALQLVVRRRQLNLKGLNAFLALLDNHLPVFGFRLVFRDLFFFARLFSLMSLLFSG